MDFNSYISVVGVNAEKKAKAIADYYGTRYAESKVDDGVWNVEATPQLEDEMCMDEDGLADALACISDASGVHISVVDINF